MDERPYHGSRLGGSPGFTTDYSGGEELIPTFDCNSTSPDSDELWNARIIYAFEASRRPRQSPQFSQALVALGNQFSDTLPYLRCD